MLTADYPSPVWSGIGTAVASQSAALVEVGVDVHVLASPWAGGGAVLAGARGPVVHRLSAERCPVRPAEFDVVHLHSLCLSGLALEMRRRFRLPLVYTAHSLVCREMQGVRGAGVWRRLQTVLMMRSDHVVFLSEDERAAAVARLPTLAARCSVLPNGMAVPLCERPAVDEAGPVMFAGRFARTKGIELLEAIVCRLAGRYRFVVAGGHGDPLGHWIVARLATSFPEACRVVGWADRETLDGLFARAGLVLIPSEYEPFGIVALEAMRAGAPVLAAGVGGLVEAVGLGSGGRLVYSRDPDAWCEGIHEILGTPALRLALRRNGPAYVALRYDPARLARRLLDEVYRPLCGAA